MPTRRSLLGTLPVTTLLPLVGCLSVPGNGSGDGGDDDDGDDDGGLPGGGSTDDETRPSGGPGVSFASVDDQPDGPLEIDVAVTREAATGEHPPGLRVSVTNTGKETVEVGEARAVVFASQYSEDGSLLLLPAGGDYPAEPGCWRLSDGIAVSEEYRIQTLAPGETMASALSLYATTESPEDACLPVGEFRFESQYTVNPETNDQRFTWGFSVVLE